MSKKVKNEEVNTQLVQKKSQAKDIIDAAVISDIPVELSNNLTLVAKRITSFLSYYSAASLTRLNTLNKFIADAEDRLYNVNVEKLDMKELNARYKEAKKAQAEIMGICSQVSKQAVDTENTARVDEIYNLLKSMSAQTLLQLKDALTGDDDSDDSDTD